MSKENVIIEHTDCLGRTLLVGQCVAVAHHNQLMIAIIKKITPKMVKISELGGRSEYAKYSSECVLLEGPEVSMYLLKNQ